MMFGCNGEAPHLGINVHCLLQGESCLLRIRLPVQDFIYLFIFLCYFMLLAAFRNRILYIRIQTHDLTNEICKKV